MPNRDGKGPRGGQKPRAGRKPGKGIGGSSKCVCPNCGYTTEHTRGVPCSKTSCPKCNTPLRGNYCK